MRIFITGDTHGDFSRIEKFCFKNYTTKEDMIIILGDSGILYDNGKFNIQFRKEFLNALPITIFAVRGNHEARPEDFNMPIYPMPFCNGIAYNEKRYSNIWYALDGSEYKINNKKILTIGGAYSIDRDLRIAMDYYWNPREQLSREERESIYKSVCGCKYDYVLTHTCPIQWEPTDLFFKDIDQTTVDKTMEKWLSLIEHDIQYKHWYFGHYHANRNKVCGNKKVTMLYDEIKEI